MNDETHFMEHRFPDGWLEQKPTYVRGQRTGEVDFVPWYRVADTLDVVFGHAGWQVYIVRCDELAGRIVMTIALDIGGAVKQNVGSAEIPDESDTGSYGDPFTNAYAQAFKRAAAMHGFGRYLYEGDDDGGTWIDTTMNTRSASTPAASPPSQASAAAPQDATTQGALIDTVIRFGKNNGRTWREVVNDPDIKEAQYAEWSCNTLPVERMSDELKAAVRVAFTDRVEMDQGESFPVLMNDDNWRDDEYDDEMHASIGETSLQWLERLRTSEVSRFDPAVTFRRRMNAWVAVWIAIVIIAFCAGLLIGTTAP